jgi:predicted ATPase
MAGRLRRAPFIGRADELAQLDAALVDAVGAKAGTVLIGGDAGVGKSRLVQEFTRQAQAVGARLLAGSCIELRGGGLPYGPFAEALRRLAQELEAEPMSDALAPAQRDLERLLHVSRQSPEGLLDTFDGRSEQVQLFALLLELLDHLGDMAPVVLVIEDLHWADQSTLDLLTFLVKSMRRERLLVVATYRTDELRPHHLLRPVLGELDRDMATSHIELRPFEREELDALVEALLDPAPSAETLDRVFRQSEGNAFFAEELVSAGISDVGVRLPRRLRDVVMTRVDTLSEEAKDTLRIAAAAGGQVKHELLSAVSELPEPLLLKALREAVVQSIIVVDPTSETYSFRHALAREAVYSDLLPGERVQLHGRLAQALAEDPSRTHSQGALTLAGPPTGEWSGRAEWCASRD